MPQEWIGRSLGPFQITAKLGEGGMGEVYRATDSRLKREVAIKVLPAAFTENKERLARFEREAQLLAQLNHSNIAQIYGIETSGATHALVMELVDGPTLAERLEAGPLSLAESLSFALQIAQALEEAHDKGIVHRDLKPQNVKASSEGKAKVLDFGLAKAMDATAGSASAADLARSPTLMNSPTLTAVHGTQLGMILGTAAYMAPEQARGAAVDKRADIWAFGVLLHEMLTGERLFEGESVVDTLSAVMRQEIDLGRLPAGTPGAIRQLLRRCLERDSKRRLRDIGEARLLLERELAGEPGVGEGGSGSSSGTGMGAAPASSTATRRLALAGVIVGTLLIGLVLGKFLLSPPPVAQNARPIRAAIAFPTGLELDGVGAPEIALSPDGATLAFLARGESGPQHLYLRRLDSDEVRKVPESETAEGPFFSPDGKWVAFAVGVSGLGGGIPRELRKQSLETGLTQTIAPIEDYFGGVWRSDGTIFLVEATDGTLSSVPASGGKPSPAVVNALDRGARSEVAIFWPELLPGGRAIVFATDERPVGELAVLDLESNLISRLGVHGMSPRYLPTGYLAFGGEGGTLEVVPFDATVMRVLGAPVAMLGDVARARHRSATYAVSANGTLVYATGYLRNSRSEPMRIVRASRDGAFAPLAIEADFYGRALAVASDGGRIALAREDRGSWVVDLERGTRTKVAGVELSGAMSVAWSPTGDRLAWVAAAPDGSAVALFVQSSDGRGTPQVLPVRDDDLTVAGWMPDGRELVFTRWGSSATIERIALDGGKSTVAWKDPGSLSASALSPDGRFVALESDAGEGYELYLFTFATGERTQVTATGGRDPFWAKNGRELFFRRGAGIYSVAVSPGADGSPRIGPEARLFDWPAAYRVAAGRDGVFFGIEPVPGAATQRSLELRTEWFADVKRLAGAGNRN